MAVKDDPNTRIKAADAETLFRSHDVRGHLQAWQETRGFKALGAIVLPVDHDEFTSTWAEDGQSQGAMERYVTGARLKMMQRECVKGLAGVIMLGIHRDGTAEIATYGNLTRDCRILGKVGAGLLDDLSVCPFQTWFGWGNDGVPKRMSAEDYGTLTENQQRYVDQNTHPEAVFS